MRNEWFRHALVSPPYSMNRYLKLEVISFSDSLSIANKSSTMVKKDPKTNVNSVDNMDIISCDVFLDVRTPMIF